MVNGLILAARGDVYEKVSQGMLGIEATISPEVEIEVCPAPPCKGADTGRGVGSKVSRGWSLKDPWFLAKTECSTGKTQVSRGREVEESRGRKERT